VVNVTHDQHSRTVWDSFQERLHQQHIDHKSFVNHQKLAIERIVVAALEAAGLWINFKKPLDRLRVASVMQPLGRSGRTAEGRVGVMTGSEECLRLNCRIPRLLRQIASTLRRRTSAIASV
jgi:hypothetical protein